MKSFRYNYHMLPAPDLLCPGWISGGAVREAAISAQKNRGPKPAIFI